MNPNKQKSSFSTHIGRIARETIATSVCVWICIVACHRQTDVAQGQARSALEVRSSDFVNGGSIPQRFTCDGADASPDLQWSDPPAGTRSIALVMHDPDALIDFTHWLVFNIPPEGRSLGEGSSRRSSMPEGSVEGANDFDRPGYGGPCPPGSKPHHYVFHLYALDIRLNLPAGATKKDLTSAIRGHVLTEGQIVGTYKHGGQ